MAAVPKTLISVETKQRNAAALLEILEFFLECFSNFQVKLNLCGYLKV
jgi:hypothetical protein